MLSPHFSLVELTMTQVRGVDNTPAPDVIEHLRILAASLEEVRTVLGHPMLVSSGYRSLDVNSLVGGSDTSDHPHGWCADFICPRFGTPLQICRAIWETDTIKFDQLIEEGTWVHFSVAPSMRGQVLTKRLGGGYSHGLTRQA